MTTYSSRLASYIVGLIEQKHMLGYSFSYGELILGSVHTNKNKL